MKELDFDRKRLLSKVGSVAQLAHITPFTYTSGSADGVKGFMASNGTGLDFTVLESKCLDIISMKYKGINLNFLPKSGIVSSALSDMEGTEFLRSICGGMMYTCGLLNVGAGCMEGDMDQPFHGRMKNTPAEHVSTFCDWDGDAFVLRISGEMRESALFNDNLLMRRSIETKAGKRCVTICDVIENQGFETQELMLLYHVNVGYPILDAGARFVAPIVSTEARQDGVSEKGIKDYAVITEPVQGFVEQVYVHKVTEGRAAIINDELGLGLYVKYDADMLPNLIEWKSMGCGDYAFGIEPATCLGRGRAYERSHGKFQKIAPFEKLTYTIEIGVLDGPEEISAFTS